MNSLSREYRAEVDSVGSAAWREQITAFSDASLYQFWNDGGPRQVSRLLLKKHDELVAAAEVRLFTVPVLRGGIAQVFWGPLWRRAGQPSNPEVFAEAIRALVDEYVTRRRMVLRINPRVFREQDPECVRILEEEGFALLEDRATKRSLIADIGPDPEELRKNFEKKWRNSLSKAERSGLEIVSGTGLDLFDEFVTVYDRMVQRKQFAPSADIQRHRRVQDSAPADLKMGIVIARHEGKACAGAIYSALGDTAVYLFGATDETGMQTSGSYLVHWTIIQQLKARGIRYYDLNGISPDSNPGVYAFKKGLGGKYGVEVTFAGQRQRVAHTTRNYSFLWLERFRQRVRSGGNVVRPTA